MDWVDWKMKKASIMISFLLMISVGLAACGNGDDSAIADGAKSMKDTLKELQTYLDANDADKVKEAAEELEETWEAFEDGVKEQSAELYEKVETPLHTIEAGAKQNPLDKETLAQATKDLDLVLSELEK